MKKGLTILIGFMLLCSLIGFCAAATSTGESSHDTTVTYTLGSKYSITIPTSVDIGTQQYIAIDNQLLALTENLCFKVDGGQHSTDSQRRMFLTGGTENLAEHHLLYNLKANLNANDADGAEAILAIDTWYILADSTEVISSSVTKSILVIAELTENQQNQHSGTYTDKVTITCDIMTDAELAEANGS